MILPYITSKLETAAPRASFYPTPAGRFEYKRECSDTRASLTIRHMI
jgi:hypothetical protein